MSEELDKTLKGCALFFAVALIGTLIIGLIWG